MPIAQTITKVGGAEFLHEWSGTGPYYIIRATSGEIITPDDNTALTTDTEITLTSDDLSEPVWIEVIDTGAGEALTDAESRKYPATATLQWRGDVDATYYKVRKDGTTVQTVTEDGSGYYTYESGSLTDETSVTFDVQPVYVDADATETTGDDLDYILIPVRNPPVPSVTITYSNPNWTVSAR